MCLSPIVIKNPNYKAQGRYSFLKDTVSPYIKVPCGVCSECVHTRQLSLVQRCICESLSGYPFFCTLTYNNESLPVLSVSSGYNIRYADFSDFTNMVKRLRKDNAFGRPFRYLAVSELGEKRGRPHFHCIFFVKRYPDDTVYTPFNLEYLLFKTVLRYWQRNYGDKRVPFYKPLCTYVSRFISGRLSTNYDLHYVSPSTLDGSTEDVPFYVSKYMLKPSDRASRLRSALALNLPEDEFNDVWKIVKPRWVSSLNFGFGVYGLQSRKLSLSERLSILQDTDSFRLVRSSIDRSLESSDYPAFYDPESGKSLPLSRYWKSFGNLFTEQDALSFFYKAPRQFKDNVVIDDRPLDKKITSSLKHEKQLSIIDDSEFDLNLLFD